MENRQANSLLNDRKNHLGEYYFSLKGKIIAEKAFDFRSIKTVFINNKAGLVHSFPCKNESRAEFYDTLFGLIMTNFMHDLYLSQMVDIMLIYIIYSTMPGYIKEQNKISIDSSCIDALIRFFREASANDNLETLRLVRFMIESDCFLVSSKIGLKTVLLDRSGNIKQAQKMIKQELLIELDEGNIKRELERDGLVSECIDSMEEYIKAKNKLISGFIVEDDTEALAYDEGSKKLIKKTQKQLGLIDKDSVNKLG